MSEVMAETDRLCPHCQLPAVLPEVCTPEVHEVIERQIARDWELFNAGYDLGKRVGAEPDGPR